MCGAHSSAPTAHDARLARRTVDARRLHGLHKECLRRKGRVSSHTERALSFSEAKGWNPKELDINAQGKTFVVTVLATAQTPLILNRERMPALALLLPRLSPSAYAPSNAPS